MKLSIIIAAYNADKYIEDTIKSALNQTIQDKEIIIVNDGSTDNTMSIVNKYLPSDLIKVYSFPYNRGAANAYNFGVLHSSGDFITFLDSDDIYLSEYAFKVLEFMNKHEADIGFSNYQAIDGTTLTDMTLYGPRRHPKYIYAFGGAGSSFPNGNQASIREMAFNIDGVNISPRSIYKRSLFFDYGLDDHRLKISNDWMRNFKFVLNGAKVVYLNEVLGYYRFHSDGNSQKNPLGNVVDIIKVFEIVLSEYSKSLSDGEIIKCREQRNNWRNTMLQVLAKSDLNTSQITQFLIENKL